MKCLGRDAERPRPGGTVEGVVSSRKFVVETQPRHERATARRMLMPLQKRLVLLLKSPPPGMFDLILDFMVVSKPRSVQSSRWDGAIFLIIPGTSCLATIVLSLRDKIHATAEALLKLAFMG